MNALLAKYHALTEREQRLVVVAGIFVIVALFYGLVWSPLNSGIEEQQKRLASQQKLLTFVQDSANRAVQLRRVSGSTKSFSGSLSQAVNNSTTRHKITISRIQPKGDDMQVWIEEAPFENLLSWLHMLEGMGIVIHEIDIASADEAGYIKVRRLELGKS